jgi:hypothetical protein
MRSGAPRAAVEGPFSFVRGKLGRYFGLDEHLALGVNIACLVPRLHPAVTWARLVGFMKARGAGHTGLGGFRRKPITRFEFLPLCGLRGRRMSRVSDRLVALGRRGVT